MLFHLGDRKHENIPRNNVYGLYFALFCCLATAIFADILNPLGQSDAYMHQ